MNNEKENKELIDAFSFYDKEENKSENEGTIGDIIENFYEKDKDKEEKLIDAFSFNKDKKEEKPNLINPITFEERDKGFEDKTYIILYYAQENEDDVYNRFYSICLGRTETYNDIKEKLVSGINIDIHRSKIITETKQTETSTGNKKYYLIPLAECISVYTFCKSVESYYSMENFDIEDYNEGAPDDTSIYSEDYKVTKEQIEYRQLMKEKEERANIIEEVRQVAINNNEIQFHNI